MSPSCRVILSDGSSWPRPSELSDDGPSAIWKVWYTPDKLTNLDLQYLAAMSQAYGYLITECTQERRNHVCREIRKELK